MTPALAEKVHRLLDQRRVLLVAGQRGEALVIGDGALHTVIAGRHDVACSCLAGMAAAPCSHTLAAMVAWYEVAE